MPACRRSFYAFPSDSADREGIQPATELGHIQRLAHGLHVLRALRACPCQQPSHLGPLTAPCLRRRRAHALPPPCPPVAARFMLSLPPRQYASAFNQPLSWDTSSVTYMYEMFQVRSARAPASTLHSWVLCLHLACAAAAPTPSRLPARLSPLFLCFFFPTRQNTALSDTNKFLTRCAWAGNAEFVSRYGSAWSSVGKCPITNRGSLRWAAEDYIADVATATAEYGLIADWDVSAITDMSYLFQNLNNFNANISSWDTSSVTNMAYMFSVRSARAPCQQPPQLGPLPARCLRRRRAHAHQPPLPPVTALFMLFLSPRQSATAFNQPLSWDTSSVTRMDCMFQVRSARAPASTLNSWVLCLHPAWAAAAPTPSRLPARLSPLFLCLPFRLAAVRVRVQPATELQHLQRHAHGLHVSRALRACPCQPPPQFWVLFLHPALRRPLPAASTLGSSACTLLAPPPPPRPPASMPACRPLFYAFPFDSAVLVGVQPAAELRHVQRHEHVPNVYRALRACPCQPAPQFWVLCLHAAYAAAAPTPSRLHARLSPLVLCFPSRLGSPRRRSTSR